MDLRRGSRWIAGAVGILLVAGLLAAYHARHHVRHLGLGDRLSGIRVSSLEGVPVALGGSGRVRIINIFATWCTECIAEMPDLSAAARTLRKRGIDVIGIDQEESAAQVEQFARRYGLSYPLYIDDDGITHAALGARYIPTTIVVAADGTILAEHVGPLTQNDFLQLARHD